MGASPWFLPDGALLCSDDEMFEDEVGEADSTPAYLGDDLPAAPADAVVGQPEGKVALPTDEYGLPMAQ